MELQAGLWKNKWRRHQNIKIWPNANNSNGFVYIVHMSLFCSDFLEVGIESVFWTKARLPFYRGKRYLERELCVRS